MPCNSRVSPFSSASPAGRSWCWRWIASTTRLPLGVTMPGKNRSPISVERGGMMTSARPEAVVKRPASNFTPSASAGLSTSSAASSATASASPRTAMRSPTSIGPSRAAPLPAASCSVRSVSPARPPRSNPARGWPTSGDSGRTLSWCTPSSRRNCSTSVRACRLRSGGSERFSRTGSRREPRRSAMRMVPMTRKTPT